MEEKHCKYCNTTKKTSEFYRSPTNADGYKSRCQSCYTTYNAKYLIRSREKTLEHYAKRAEKRKQIKESLSLEQRQSNWRIWADNNNERLLLAGAKHRAKKRNIPFNIELSDIIIPEYCPILKTPIDKDRNRGPYSASLDRIDNELGYIKGNVRVISLIANKIKGASSKKDLLAFSDNIKEYLK